jgi:head-tail adaptor
MASTTDDYGNTTGTWSDHASRYAHLIERLGQEDIEQGALQDVAVATMRVRADTLTNAITTADRVLARGVYWAITSIMQVTARGDLLEIKLEKGIAA